MNAQFTGDYSLDDFETFISGMNDAALTAKLDQLHTMLARIERDTPDYDFITNCYMFAENELERRATDQERHRKAHHDLMLSETTMSQEPTHDR
jgi:hypothetical protein